MFSFAGRDLIAATNKDGSLYLLDGASLGGVDHKTPLAKLAVSPAAEAGTLATWEDTQQVRWILVASVNSVVAVKVVNQGGKPALQTGWNANGISDPTSPIVVNGVVFAASRRSAGGSKAVLYALDGETGKSLWNSGTTIASNIVSGGLSSSQSEVYLETADSFIYSFGHPLYPIGKK